MLLLDLARERCAGHPERVVAVHVDHGLRRDSAHDAAFVSRWAAGAGIPCVVARAAAGPPEAPGLEARARRARYAAFRRVAEQWNLSHLLLGHHADDQAESVLMRVLRRSGPRGLSGIPATRRLTPACLILRPLLHISRRAILAEAKRRGLAWVSDPTNADRRHLRNRLRHAVLAAEGAALRERALRIAAEAAAVERELERWARTLRPFVLREQAEDLLVLRRSPIESLDDALLHALLRPPMEAVFGTGGFGRQALRNLKAALRSGRPRTLPRDLCACPLGEDLLLVHGAGGRVSAARVEPGVPLPVPGLGGRLHLRPLDSASAIRRSLRQARRDPFVQVLDRDALSGHLHAGNAAPGARLRPLGASGRKKVGDLLAEAGWPRHLRPRVPVLLDDAGPLWVPGRPPAERTRIRPSCQRAALLVWEAPPVAVLEV